MKSLTILATLLALVVMLGPSVAVPTSTASAAVVSPDGWELQNPLSQCSNDLNGVWGTSGSDVFAVGDAGTIMHYDGSSWTPMTSGTTENLNGVWGSSPSDVFVVGDAGTLVHYDGTSWSSMSSGTTTVLRGVWGSSPSDVFVAGGAYPSAPIILHWDGSSWSVMPVTVYTYYYYGIWGSSSSDVFAVGYSGTIDHYDGSSWSSMTSGTFEDLWGVWGSSATDVFAVGGTITAADPSDVRNGNVILHYDGSSWSAMNSGSTKRIQGVWGSSSSNVFAVGGGGTILHYDGQSWTPMGTITTSTLKGIWSSSSSDVFAVGYNGTILHYDGTVWSAMNSGSTAQFEDVWGSSASDIFAIGWSYKATTTVGSEGGDVLHYDGNTWTPMIIQVSNEKLCGVWGSSSSDVFAVGSRGTILHYDGSNWTVMATASALLPQVSAQAFTGTTWVTTTVSCTAGLLDVWGTTASDVFAVGWDFQPSMQDPELGAWTGRNELLILHYDGSAWTVMNRGSVSSYYYNRSQYSVASIWGGSSSDVFVVGRTEGWSSAMSSVVDKCTIVHYDGTSWSVMNSGTTVCFEDVWGTSGSDVFAVGGGGTIYHYDGSSWNEMNSGTNAKLYSISGSSSDVFVVGETGTILHRGSATVATIDPSRGSRGQTLNVTITGKNFAGSTSVSFGDGVTVNSFNVDSSTQISANITIAEDAATGPRDVSVTTAGGTATLSGGFTVTATDSEEQQQEGEDQDKDGGGFFSCTCGQIGESAPSGELLIGWGIIAFSAAAAYWVATKITKPMVRRRAKSLPG